MRKIVFVIEKLPVWYGLGIVLLYSLLYAEFLTIFLKLFPYEEVLNDIFKTILSVSYATAILSGFITWMIYTLLFHLMAMLFGGQLSFKRFLFATAYPYLIPACVVFAGIILLDGVQPLNLGDTEDLLMQNSTVQIAINLLKYSVAPYYLIVAVFIRHIYQMKYIYAALSVAIPIVSIWLITELFKLI